MANELKGILLLTGAVGTGKTTVAAEIGGQLADIGLPNAVIDLDWLGWVNVGEDFHDYDRLIVQNLVSSWENYRAVGVQYLILARALTQREPLELLTEAFPNTPITVVRLVASRETVEKRLSQRDSGETLREHLAEMDEMNKTMDELHLEQAAVITDGLSVEDVARKVVKVVEWKPS